jgi:mono/diheme cytochrome c family protein
MSDENDIEVRERRTKWWLLIVSGLTLVVLVTAALRENVLVDWRQYQLQYADLLREVATDDRGREIADRFGIHLRQNVIPDLGRTDRCVTCHTGLDDPRMKGQPQPHATHPGNYLAVHDPSKFGCTVCHQGQGLATEVEDAHGRVDFWDYPMLESQHSRTTCSRCHEPDQLAGTDGLWARADNAESSEGVELVTRGRRLAEAKGCYGCHVVEGRGGTLGPDITTVGDRTRHTFDFSHLPKGAPREVAYWLRQHFLEPTEISPGTVMPDLSLTESDADALTAFMLSLRKKVDTAGYRYDAAIVEGDIRDLSGADLYAMNCASCHGADGRESSVPGIRSPALNNEDALAVAGDDYYRSIIVNGRSGSAMPAWGPRGGNLSKAEIDRLIGHIREWEPEGPNPLDVSAATGDPQIGAALYKGLCGNCHGRQGEGGIGNRLNSITFLSIADDAFLADAIINGRPRTAMASWKHLSRQEVSDILAHIRSWQKDAPSYSAVRKSAREMPKRRLETIGRSLYQGNCAVCHGKSGEGEIGTRLATDDLLRVVDDRYLYDSIVDGRPTTAMPAWSHLSADHIAALLAYIRTWQDGDRIAIPKAPVTGDYSLGRVHYETSCQACHGVRGEGGSGPQLANRAFLSAASNDQLYYWIGHGRHGSAMKGFLPEEHGPTTLKRGQIADVIAYIRHLSTSADRRIVQTGAGDASVGGQFYAGNCASCHGVDGEGASGPQLNNPQFLNAASDGFLAATIALGRTDTPMRAMLHGSEGLGQIPPKNVMDVVAYMRLWEGDADRKPRPIAEVSPIAVATGKKMYEQFCSGCHGTDGGGKRDGEDFFAPALNNPEFLAAASDGYLLATIARGRSRTPMRPFGEGAGGIASLKPEEINTIVAYLRSWENP